MQTDDILEFGMIPELVGRLPVISSLAPLDHAGLVRVLTEPKNALVKQYQKLFEMEDCQLEFTESALQAIATKALDKGTGARGLRSIVEHVMVDIMFELPDQPKAPSTSSTKTSSSAASRSSVQEPMQKSASLSAIQLAEEQTRSRAARDPRWHRPVTSIVPVRLLHVSLTCPARLPLPDRQERSTSPADVPRVGRRSGR